MVMTHNQDNRMSGIIDKLEELSVELRNFLSESLEPQERMFIGDGIDGLDGVVTSLYETIDE